jgi:hypothetical protein
VPEWVSPYRGDKMVALKVMKVQARLMGAGRRVQDVIISQRLRSSSTVTAP